MNYLDQLPRFAGIRDAAKIALPVETCATRLTRLAAAEYMMMKICAGRMAMTPEWEVKALMGRWIWESAEAYALLEQRLRELRTHPSVIEKTLSYRLGDFFGEILQAPNTLAVLLGLIEVASSTLVAEMERYLGETQPLADFPSARLLQRLLLDERERLRLGREAIAALSLQPDGAKITADWLPHFRSFLAYAGGLVGDANLPTAVPVPRANGEFRIPQEFRRDARFQTTLPKQGPKEFEGDDLHTMMWARSQEMTAAELVATVIYEWEDLPTAGLVDLARHCWDETRHSLFGEVALEGERRPLQSLPSWIGYAQHTLPVSPPKRYAHLALATEANLMAYPGGKRGDWEYCRDTARHPLMTTLQDFDWADEVNHVNFGRRWLIDFHFKGDRETARKVADETVAERKAYYQSLGFDDKRFAKQSSRTDY